MEILEHGNSDESSDMAIAIAVGQALNRHYPNHPWVVAFQGRGVVIRHLAIAECVRKITGKDGFSALLPASVTQRGTPKSIAHAAAMFGGQLLETFGLPRAAWDGREPNPPDWDRGTKSFQ